MAGASAKKSAAAKASTAKIYRPILAVANLIYIVLYAWLGRAVSIKFALIHLLLLGLQIYAYFGILEDAASRPQDDTALAGGASLDLLGAVFLLQYLGGLISYRFYYLLGLLPIWGGWKLYTLFYGGENKRNKRAETAKDEPSDDDDAKERRQRRAEKRRQKRS